MGEGTGQPDNTPRPDDATIIGGDATVVDGEIGMPAGPMPETIAGYAIKGAIGAGGMGSVYGPLIGAFAFLLLEELLAGWTEHWMLFLGPALILVVLFARNGLWGLAEAAAGRTGRHG